MLEKFIKDLNNDLIKSNISETQRSFILTLVVIQLTLKICKIAIKENN